MPQSAYPTTTEPYAGAELLGEPADLAGDLLRLVVQQRRQRVDVDRPAAPFDDRGRGLGQRAARDQRDPVTQVRP